MNAHLSERFRGIPRRDNSRQQDHDNLGLHLSLNLDIRKYADGQERISSSRKSDTWLDLPEFPTSEEILIDQHQEIDLLSNKQKGRWKSKEKYLKAQYGLLR